MGPSSSARRQAWSSSPSEHPRMGSRRSPGLRAARVLTHQRLTARRPRAGALRPSQLHESILRGSVLHREGLVGRRNEPVQQHSADEQRSSHRHRCPADRPRGACSTPPPEQLGQPPVDASQPARQRDQRDEPRRRRRSARSDRPGGSGSRSAKARHTQAATTPTPYPIAPVMAYTSAWITPVRGSCPPHLTLTEWTRLRAPADPSPAARQPMESFRPVRADDEATGHGYVESFDTHRRSGVARPRIAQGVTVAISYWEGRRWDAGV